MDTDLIRGKAAWDVVHCADRPDNPEPLDVSASEEHDGTPEKGHVEAYNPAAYTCRRFIDRRGRT